MDPNTVLTRIRQLIEQLSEVELESYDHAALSEELADAIASLDCWLNKGGFLPDDWKPKEQP